MSSGILVEPSNLGGLLGPRVGCMHPLLWLRVAALNDDGWRPQSQSLGGKSGWGHEPCQRQPGPAGGLSTLLAHCLCSLDLVRATVGRPPTQPIHARCIPPSARSGWPSRARTGANAPASASVPPSLRPPASHRVVTLGAFIEVQWSLTQPCMSALA